MLRKNSIKKKYQVSLTLFHVCKLSIILKVNHDERSRRSARQVFNIFDMSSKITASRII